MNIDITPPFNKGFIYGLYDNDSLFYIGQTQKSLRERYNRHISKSYLYNERFTKKSKKIIEILKNNYLPNIEILDIVDLKDLDFYEIFYIGYFKSLEIQLTNGTNGGVGNIFTNNKWNKIPKDFDINNNYIFEKNYDLKKEKKIRSNIRHIIQYDLNGNFIKKYDGIMNASNETKIHTNLIHQHCTSDKKYYKAKSKVDNKYYTFRYENDPFDYYEWDKVQKHQKKVYCYDMEGNFIRTYNSIAETERELNLIKKSITLKKNKEGFYRITYDYIFLIEGEEFDINKIPSIIKGKIKGISKLDDEKNIIKTYVSIGQAEKDNNIRDGGLSGFIKRNPDQTKKYKGFNWKLI